MADGVTLQSSTLATPAAGTEIATDDCGADGHVQIIKLARSTDGSATLITADASGLMVQLGAALPAGANAIGKLAANSGVDIGDVDVTSVIPGTGATNGGKAVDSAAGSTDTGVATLAVRDDALSTLTPADGDYTHLRTDANGALWVIPSGTVTVSVSGTATVSGTVAATQSGAWNITNVSGTISLPSGASTLAEQQTQTAHHAAIRTAVELIDDAIVADDAAFTPATTKVMMAGFEFDDSTPDSVNEGDAGAGRMSANRCQYTMIRDGAGNERGANVDADGYLQVNSGTAGMIVNGYVDHDAPLDGSPVLIGGRASAAAPASVSGDDDAVAAWFVRNGAQAITITCAGAIVPGDATSGLFTQVKGDALTALQLIDDVIFVDDAAFTPGTSKVAAVGMQADETATDSVDEGDVGCPRMTLDRKAIVTDYAHTAGGLSAHSGLSSAAVYTSEVKGSAGQIYGVEIFNKGAAAVYVRLYNQTGAPASGDAANIVWRGIVPGSPAGAGIVKTWPKGLACATGIGIRVSGAIADNDTTVLTANEVTINVGYK